MEEGGEAKNVRLACPLYTHSPRSGKLFRLAGLNALNRSVARSCRPNQKQDSPRSAGQVSTNAQARRTQQQPWKTAAYSCYSSSASPPTPPSRERNNAQFASALALLDLTAADYLVRAVHLPRFGPLRLQVPRRKTRSMGRREGEGCGSSWILLMRTHVQTTIQKLRAHYSREPALKTLQTWYTTSVMGGPPGQRPPDLRLENYP